MTNYELLEKSILLSKYLEEKGVKVCDTIAISSENILNYFIAVCATIYRGATVTLVNPDYVEGDLKFLYTEKMRLEILLVCSRYFTSNYYLYTEKKNFLSTRNFYLLTASQF